MDPKLYNISSVIVGFALIDNFSAAEQNAIGNWFITVGQILENNSAWQQLIENRITNSNININSKEYKRTGNPYTDGNKYNDSQFINDEITSLKKSINIIMEQLNSMK